MRGRVSSLWDCYRARRASAPLGTGVRYNAESALDALLDDLQEFRAESARPAAPSVSEHMHEISCYCPRICLVSMLPHAPEAASVPVCHGYGHVALELVSREPDHQVPPLVPMPQPCALALASILSSQHVRNQ